MAPVEELMPSGYIAIVDDDEAIRLSTSNLLTRAGFRAKLFESGDDFLVSSASITFSCILLDVQMPGSDGLAVLRALAERGEPPPIVVITAHGAIGVAVEAMKLGACDFVEKPYASDFLLEAIRKALGARSTGEWRRGFVSEAVAIVQTLTERQRQVLQGIVHGRPNKMIAWELGLSVRTVEAYRSQMMERLGARGTAEAVRVAIAAGLVADGPLYSDLQRGAPREPRDSPPARTLFPLSRPR